MFYGFKTFYHICLAWADREPYLLPLDESIDAMTLVTRFADPH